MKMYNNGQRKAMMYGGMSKRKPMMYGAVASPASGATSDACATGRFSLIVAPGKHVPLDQTSA